MIEDRGSRVWDRCFEDRGFRIGDADDDTVALDPESEKSNVSARTHTRTHNTGAMDGGRAQEKANAEGLEIKRTQKGARESEHRRTGPR